VRNGNKLEEVDIVQESSILVSRVKDEEVTKRNESRASLPRMRVLKENAMTAKNTANTTTNVTALTQAQIDEYTKLIAQKNKAKDRAKTYREQNADKAKAWSERARVRGQILIKKAKEAGLTVSEKEVDEYILNMKEETSA
jgi:hypothetical protein